MCVCVSMVVVVAADVAADVVVAADAAAVPVAVAGCWLLVAG